MGRVVRTGQPVVPYLLLDGGDEPVVPVSDWTTDLIVGDASPNTCRAYCYALLTWFRVLWTIEVDWQRATEGDVAAMVGWMRAAKNPQRVRRPDSAPAGSVNLKTGKRYLPDRYGASTINLTLAAVRGFYEFHAHLGEGPVLNPVPESRLEAMVNRHRTPDTPRSPARRGRLRQKSPIRCRAQCLTWCGTNCSRRWEVTATGLCCRATSAQGRGPPSCWACG